MKQKQPTPKMKTGSPLPEAKSEALIHPKNVGSIQAMTNGLRMALNTLKVSNDDECLAARGLLDRIMTARGRAEAFINPILANAKEGLALARTQETALVGPLREMEATARVRINAYLTDVNRKVQEQAAEQERLKREYEEKIARSKRPERIKPVAEIPAEEVIEAPKMESTSVPMVPKYEVEDESKIPGMYWKRVLNRELLWDQIRLAHKEGRECAIPGVRIWEEASMTIRRG